MLPPSSQPPFSTVGPDMLDPLPAFLQAVAQHEQGRLQEAERLYEIVLAAHSFHFEALCRLGSIRLQLGRFEQAAALFRRAIEVDRNSALPHHQRGFALTGGRELPPAQI